MAEHATESGSEQERYASFETDDGDVIVYDRDQSDAWIQSDTVRRVRD